MSHYWFLLLVTVYFSCYVGALRLRNNNNKDLVEGDIAGINRNMDRNTIVNKTEFWPNGIVYYEIHHSLKKIEGLEDTIHKAIANYESRTCLRFREKTDDTKDYVKFRKSTECSSYIGRHGGMQSLKLDDGCYDIGSVVHEMGHAVGLYHEHNRSDRNKYVKILWDNIQKGCEGEYTRLKSHENNLLGEEFDFDSIMLYDEYSCSIDGKLKTMISLIKHKKIGSIEDKPGLSIVDARKLRKMYKCDRK